MEEYDVLVVGGGFYGCLIACHLRRRYPRVLVVEKRSDLLERASYVNQARVHQGYHYPRSLLTGLRSRVNFARFVKDYAFCIDQDFEKYYAIGRNFSKVTAAQFQLFCDRIGAPLEPAPAAVRSLFNPRTVEDVFRVEEVAFDAVKLREHLRRRLADEKVKVAFDTEVVRVRPLPGGLIAVTARQGKAEVSWRAGQVYNCTYSQLNQLLGASGLAAVPLKHEIVEMALVRVPEVLRRVGITLMCGPFFSVMPFPSAGLHTLSHVRYTPHAAWFERDHHGPTPHALFDGMVKRTHFDRMRRDASRYVPVLDQLGYERSIWEVKTVLPANEGDDGRPILFLSGVGLPKFYCILGAKIDNIYDVLEEIDQHTEPRVKVAS
jgi:glycine/D-amino acid oxidase-like deaminating enzyme